MLTVQAWDMAGKLADPRTWRIAGTSLNVALMSLSTRGLKGFPDGIGSGCICYNEADRIERHWWLHLPRQFRVQHRLRQQRTGA